MTIDEGSYDDNKDEDFNDGREQAYIADDTSLERENFSSNERHTSGV